MFYKLFDLKACISLGFPWVVCEKLVVSLWVFGRSGTAAHAYHLGCVLPRPLRRSWKPARANCALLSVIALPRGKIWIRTDDRMNQSSQMRILYNFQLRTEEETATGWANAAKGWFCIGFNWELDKKRPLGSQSRILYHLPTGWAKAAQEYFFFWSRHE